MKTISLFLIIFSVLIIVVGIIKLHELPKKIALSRNHPQVDAIAVCSLLGLLIFPFWMFALLWAYMHPVLKPIEVDNLQPSIEEGQS
jgi:uncharacterized membrane protein YidH (DUF202 family)